jgi:translation initiation factor IF-3
MGRRNVRGEANISTSTRTNGQIRAPQLRVIDQDGKQLGILNRSEALQLAAEAELDLVEISPNADPPVCKIVDWGKYNYQKTKQAQKNRKTAKALEMKQMRFGLKIGDHDLAVKMKKVTSFLETGHKVKITLFFRGRELAHKDIGFNLADRVITSFGEQIVVDQSPQLNGKQLTFVIRANPGYKPSPAPKQAQTNAAIDISAVQTGKSDTVIHSF